MRIVRLYLGPFVRVGSFTASDMRSQIAVVFHKADSIVVLLVEAIHTLSPFFHFFWGGGGLDFRK